MTDKEAMKLALDWFKCYADGSMSRNNAEALADEVVEALKERLADPMREVQRLGQEIEQEPVAWQDTRKTWVDVPLKNVLKEKRTWVGLTDEDMYVVSEEESCSFIAGAKWSEAILKEKNT